MVPLAFQWAVSHIVFWVGVQTLRALEADPMLAEKGRNSLLQKGLCRRVGGGGDYLKQMEQHLKD